MINSRFALAYYFLRQSDDVVVAACSWALLTGMKFPQEKAKRIAWALIRKGKFAMNLLPASVKGSWAWYRNAAWEEKMYNHWFRIDKATFNMILDLIKCHPLVERRNTRWRKCVPPPERLAMTLMWLAHATHFKSIGEKFGRGRSTAHAAIMDTLETLDQVLPSRFIKFPSGSALQKVMADFEEHGFEGCAGAIDGSFIPIITPAGPWGYKYWCYKGFHSIILMAVCDSNYRFTYINVGEPGSIGDSAAFQMTPLARALTLGQALPRGLLIGENLSAGLSLPTSSLCSLSWRQGLLIKVWHRKWNEIYRGNAASFASLDWRGLGEFRAKRGRRPGLVSGRFRPKPNSRNSRNSRLKPMCGLPIKE